MIIIQIDHSTDLVPSNSLAYISININPSEYYICFVLWPCDIGYGFAENIYIIVCQFITMSKIFEFLPKSRKDQKHILGHIGQTENCHITNDLKGKRIIWVIQYFAKQHLLLLLSHAAVPSRCDVRNNGMRVGEGV